MVTGLEDKDAIHRAFEAGASSFTTKPVNFPMLIQQIDFVLRANHTETRLREQTAKLKVAQRLARIGYWRFDKQHESMECSDQLAKFCGLSATNSKLSFSDYLQLVHKDDRTEVKKVIEAAINQGLPGSMDYRLQPNSETKLYVHQEIQPVMQGENVDNVLGTVQDISQQHEAENKLRKMAFYDPLTGLASRNFLILHLDKSLKNAKRTSSQNVLLFLDLDGFKDINDSLGHDMGDYLLTIIAGRLKSALRENDFIARLGGDEFCVLIDDITHDDSTSAARIAESCLSAVNRPVELGVRTVTPRISIGIAHYPQDANTVQDLLKAADSAMYAAKLAGKHRYTFYNESMTKEAEQRLAFEEALRHAQANNEFELVYQPQISSKQGKLIAVEALVRWHHPSRGLIPPIEFISVIEHMGLMPSFGDWVLHTACKQLVSWNKAGFENIRVAVNISPYQFCDNRVINTVKSVLKETGIRPEYLELEITENALQTGHDVVKGLEQLSQLGLKIAIDDFGTGYSSLSSLKDLPLDCLKIDREFVKDIIDDPEGAMLCKNIMNMAHSMGFEVVAEGAETIEQVRALCCMGCDLIQGYYFSRPVNVEAIPALIDRDYRLDCYLKNKVFVFESKNNGLYKNTCS